MELDKIKVGQILCVTGKKGNCGAEYGCYNCRSFEGDVKTIMVTRIIAHSPSNKFITGQDIHNSSTLCNFMPEDLTPQFTTWKKRYK